MHQRWLLLTALALTTSSVHAQSAPTPAAPSPRAPGAATTAPADVPSAPSVDANAPAAPAAPARAPASVAPAAPGAIPSAPADEASPPSSLPVAEVPPPGATYAPPPAQPGVSDGSAPAVPHELGAHEVRLASPRLYPIEPRPRPPRRYGDAGAPFAVGIGGSVIWRDDVGYELFSRSKHSSALELFASYDVWAPSPAVVFALGAALRSELHEADATFELAHNALQAEASARFMATRWLWPHLRIAAGFMASRFTAQDLDTDLVFEDRDLGFVGSLGGGFTLRTPARLFETYRGRLASLSLGVMLEGGYTLASAASLRATPKGSSEIPRDTFSFGELERGGPYLRVLFVVRF